MDTTLVGEIRARLPSTLGATFLGFACTCVLYGITSLQTWMYFDYQFKDEGLLRGTVLILWVLDTFHMLFLTMTLYRDIVVDFGNISAILSPSCADHTSQTKLVSNLIVRAIFGMRIWRLSGGHWFIPVCLVNVLSLFVLGSIRSLSVSTLLDVREFSWSFYTGFAVEVIADSIITVSQCALLTRMKTGFERTDSLISFMMRYSINTGLLTSICAALVLVTASTGITTPNDFIYQGFYFVYSKLYVNSLLATLNARRRTRIFRDGLAVQRVPDESVPDMEFKSHDYSLGRPAELTTIIDINSRIAQSSTSEAHEF
ncbi:hypothetical protein BC628DRAFT_1329232 [Trametes gibbosa]|nr:hypothetical protein BC628DRAFT_1329232 [Trametes gibbosa]